MKNLIIFTFLSIYIVFSAYSMGGADMSDKLNFEYSGIEKIEISGALFDINIEGKDMSNVTGKIETSNEDYMLYHKKDGNTLAIWFERPWWAVFSFPGTHMLTLKVPESTSIHIDNSSGKVDVKNINAEDVVIKASSGKIIAENIKAEQKYGTSSGNIVVKTVSAKNEISIKASSGDIQITDSIADLKVRTSSGKIFIKDSNSKKAITSSSGAISISSSNGTIEGRSSSGKQTYKIINGDIKANASSGSIIIEDTNGSLELHTSSGNIKGEDINISADSSFKTTSGNIIINYSNTFDDFTFDLKASSGKLKAGSIDARKELHAGNGSITITGRSTSGKQFYE